MPDKFDSTKLYVVTGDFLNGLKSIETRLYHNDFKRLSADDTRDMANYLNHQTEQVFELETNSN